MTRHPDLGLFIPPNLAEMGADAKELQEALARLEKYANERREISGKLSRHFRTLELAKEKDSRAFAEAIRAGKKNPPAEVNVEKAEEERAALERRGRALDFLLEELRAEIHTLINSHLEEWRRQSEGALERARERYSDAIEELIEARGQFFATDQALQWLEDPNRRYAPALGVAPVVLNLDETPGTKPREQTQIAPILEAMRFELGNPERRKANTVFLVEAEPGEEKAG
jgi:chromosome segregation ATPase